MNNIKIDIEFFVIRRFIVEIVYLISRNNERSEFVLQLINQIQTKRRRIYNDTIIIQQIFCNVYQILHNFDHQNQNCCKLFEFFSALKTIFFHF